MFLKPWSHVSITFRNWHSHLISHHVIPVPDQKEYPNVNVLNCCMYETLGG